MEDVFCAISNVLDHKPEWDTSQEHLVGFPWLPPSVFCQELPAPAVPGPLSGLHSDSVAPPLLALGKMLHDSVPDGATKGWG